MPVVLTADQRGSRRTRDLVDEALSVLRRHVPRPMLPFERTAGDEFQGVLSEGGTAVDVSLALLRQDSWSVGLGIGPVEEPLPSSTRSARGPAFVNARTALESAKRRPHHIAVIGTTERAHDADVVMTLLATLVSKRSDAGWQAVDLVAAGSSFNDAADTLGISRQAIGQRLAVAMWQQEKDARPVVARLLEEAS